MVLGDAVTKLQTFVWIFNHVSRVTTKIRSLYGFGGRCNKITDVCMDL